MSTLKQLLENLIQNKKYIEALGLKKIYSWIVLTLTGIVVYSSLIASMPKTGSLPTRSWTVLFP